MDSDKDLTLEKKFDDVEVILGIYHLRDEYDRYTDLSGENLLIGNYSFNLKINKPLCEGEWIHDFIYVGDTFLQQHGDYFSNLGERGFSYEFVNGVLTIVEDKTKSVNPDKVAEDFKKIQSLEDLVGFIEELLEEPLPTRNYEK